MSIFIVARDVSKGMHVEAEGMESREVKRVDKSGRNVTLTFTDGEMATVNAAKKLACTYRDVDTSDEAPAPQPSPEELAAVGAVPPPPPAVIPPPPAPAAKSTEQLMAELLATAGQGGDVSGLVQQIAAQAGTGPKLPSTLSDGTPVTYSPAFPAEAAAAQAATVTEAPEPAGLVTHSPEAVALPEGVHHEDPGPVQTPEVDPALPHPEDPAPVPEGTIEAEVKIQRTHATLAVVQGRKVLVRVPSVPSPAEASKVQRALEAATRLLEFDVAGYVQAAGSQWELVKTTETEFTFRRTIVEA